MPSIAAVTMGQYLGGATILLLSVNQIFLIAAGPVSTTRTSVHLAKMVPRSSLETSTLLSMKLKCL